MDFSTHNIHVYDMKDIFTPTELDSFMDFLEHCKWHDKVPGGFLTNCPQRLVNSFGNGSTINDDGTINNDGWDSTYWTTCIKHSKLTLETKPEKFPAGLANIVPWSRELFRDSIPDAAITPNTFNIAVCNKYCDPSHEIKAHTDCNDWYPSECSLGPVFASITVYPDTKPASDSEHARFQVKLDGKWHDLVLPHMSITIMPSGIEHRVMKHRSKDKFHNRINITLRSTYPKHIDALRNAQAVGNHARYYRIPYAIHHPYDIDQKIVHENIEIFNDFNSRHDAPDVLTVVSVKSDEERTQMRRELIKKIKKDSSMRVNNNTVYELCDMVSKYS